MYAADLAANEKKVWVEIRVPLRRLGEPDDIAGVVVFLASDLAKYETGEQILVDGEQLEFINSKHCSCCSTNATIDYKRHNPLASCC
jgi:hypothetical protein